MYQDKIRNNDRHCWPISHLLSDILSSLIYEVSTNITTQGKLHCLLPQSKEIIKPLTVCFQEACSSARTECLQIPFFASLVRRHSCEHVMPFCDLMGGCLKEGSIVVFLQVHQAPLWVYIQEYWDHMILALDMWIIVTVITHSYLASVIKTAVTQER